MSTVSIAEEYEASVLIAVHLAAQASHRSMFNKRNHLLEHGNLCAQEGCITLRIFATVSTGRPNGIACGAVFVECLGIETKFLNFRITKCLSTENCTRTVSFAKVAQSNHCVHLKAVQVCGSTSE